MAPSLGRFTQEDPIRSGMNWYIAFENNPLSYIDPWGLAAVAIRDFVDQSAGGKASWSDWTKTATFTIDGTKLKTNASGSDNNGGFNIWNEGGSMMADDSDLNAFFNIAGTVTIASHVDPDKPYIHDSNGNRFKIEAFSGHAYIEYTPLGSNATDTYGTHPDGPAGKGMYKNGAGDTKLMNSTHTGKYSKNITSNRETKMFNAINASENNTWSEVNNCAVFASKVFSAATGYSFAQHSRFGLIVMTPKTLKEQIQKK